jgi:hypothetical protein
VVAYLSRMFEGHEVTDQEEGLLALIQGYTSLEEHQKDDSLCKDLLEATEFRLHNNLLCYQPKGAKHRR